MELNSEYLKLFDKGYLIFEKPLFGVPSKYKSEFYNQLSKW